MKKVYYIETCSLEKKEFFVAAVPGSLIVCRFRERLLFVNCGYPRIF